MKKLFLFLILVVLSGLALGACYDGDIYNDPNDKDPIYTQSFVSEGDARKIDACMDQHTLWEYDCSANGGFKVDCEYGCENGACRVQPNNQLDIVQGMAVTDVEGKGLSTEIILLLVLLGAVIAIQPGTAIIFGTRKPIPIGTRALLRT